METFGRHSIIRFGLFELDLRAGELRKHGIKLKVQEKPFTVLTLLLENPNEVVAREYLRERLWPSDTFVDFDHSLAIAVHKLRQVLGDSAENPRFVETVGRRGYRFIAPVHRPSASALSDGRKMIAVLPFDNLGADPHQEYFADGMTEEMITQLGRLNARRLGVIARSSAMRYRHTEKTIAQIGQELGVQYVLEGSVRRAGGKVRITAQLVQVDDQTHLWAETYERGLKDVLSLQTDVAERIAHSLAVELVPEQQALIARSSTHSSEAYELYLQGRYHWNKRIEAEFVKAIEFFNQAIEKDPGYALAYAGLADAYSIFHYYGTVPPKVAYEKAKAAALTALQIDGKLAEAHSSLAFVTLEYEWDWPAAEKEYRRAIECNPNYAPAYDWYGLNLTQVGRFSEAHAVLEQARRMDPLSSVINSHLGWLYYFSRHYDRAIEVLRKTLEMEPTFALGSWFLGLAYIQKDQLADAIAELRKAAEFSGAHPAAFAALAFAYGLSGQHAEGRQALEKLTRLSGERHISPYFMAYAVASLGSQDEVFNYLEQAYIERSGWLIYLKLDPVFDRLRSDPRLTDLMQRVDPLTVGATQM